MVKLSVVIPIYNAEVCLSKCLDSLLEQTLKEIEILCVNDGSTDGTPKILETYANRDQRFYIMNERNMGPGAARNNGLSVARGEYLISLSAGRVSQASCNLSEPLSIACCASP